MLAENESVVYARLVTSRKFLSDMSLADARASCEGQPGGCKQSPRAE